MTLPRDHDDFRDIYPGRDFPEFDDAGMDGSIDVAVSAAREVVALLDPPFPSSVAADADYQMNHGGRDRSVAALAAHMIYEELDAGRSRSQGAGSVSTGGNQSRALSHAGLSGTGFGRTFLNLTRGRTITTSGSAAGDMAAFGDDLG